MVLVESLSSSELEQLWELVKLLLTLVWLPSTVVTTVSGKLVADFFELFDDPVSDFDLTVASKCARLTY